MVKRLDDAGVGFMAGTDTPIGFLTPGFSLHRELEMLVRGGLSPLQAIEAATLQPALYFGLEDAMGLIEKGMLADLILLEANPLDDIRNTTKINSLYIHSHPSHRLTRS